MYESDPALLCAHSDAAFSARFNHDTLWQKASEVLWPDAADFLFERTPGQSRTQKIYDSTPALSLTRFAAAEQAMLTPRASRWHRLRASNEDLNRDSSVQRWFDDATKQLFNLRQRGRFYGHAHVCYMSDGAFGNACMFVDSDVERGLMYKTTPIREVAIALDFRGEVDTIYHRFKLTAKQAIDYYGTRAPGKVRDAVTLRPHEPFEFLRAVSPNPDHDPDGFGWESMRFRSCDVFYSEKEKLTEGGYHEMPYLYSRYSVGPTEIYGRGPCSIVLPDIFSLQAIDRTFMRAGERAVAPPLFAANDGVLGAGGKQINLRPNAVNYGGVNGAGQMLVHPLENRAKLDWTHEIAEGKRQNVRAAFLETLWQILLENPGTMTATEVLQRAQEKGQLLSPFIGQKQDEWLTPMVARELNVLLRAGLLPPPPEALMEAAGEYEIEYESPATRLQQMEEVSGAARTLELAGPLIQLDPSLAEVLNGEEIIRASARVTGMAEKMLRSRDELAKIRRVQLEAAEQQHRLEQAAALASAAKDGATAAREAAALPPGVGDQAAAMFAEAA